MIFIYTNCQNIDQAKEMGEKIIRAKAASLVNIWPVESIFVSEDNVRKEKESILLIQTQEKNLVKLENFIKKSQNYTGIPFIGVLNIDRMNQEYKNWAVKWIV